MDKKTYIIAEIGNMHNGSVQLAKRFIKSVAATGADAVKFQTHIFEAESLPDAPSPEYFNQESRKSYFRRTAFNLSEWRELKNYAQNKCGIEFLSSVFSLEAVDLLEKIGIRKHKIPSGEVNNLPLLERVAKTGKPVLLSSGMSTWKELDQAVKILRKGRSKNITILQCASVYPCQAKQVGLNILPELKKRYGFAVGLSDHTLGVAASVTAIVLGASVIEKHFTLAKNMYGSDAKHSLTPGEFRLFVKELKDTQDMLSAKVNKDKAARELKEMKIIFEKSIVAKNRIKKGESITLEKVAFKKPGDGIKANEYKKVLGRKTLTEIPANTQIKWGMLK